MAQSCRGHSISEATLYAWKNRFGGISPSELQRLKYLEGENRLKQLYAERSLEH